MTAQAYRTTAASSLPVDLALREEAPFSGIQRVDLTERAIEGDRDYWSVNPEGYLPGQLRDDGAGVEPATRLRRILRALEKTARQLKNSEATTDAEAAQPGRSRRPFALRS